jgi:hypothetical protein
MNIDEGVPEPEGAGEFALPSDDAAHMLELLKRSSSVELKATLPFSDRNVLQHLGFDPVDAIPGQCYFFETADLALNKAGLMIRARRGPGGRGDTSFRLRAIDPAMIDRKFVHDADCKIEIDVLRGDYVCSASIRGRCTSADVYHAGEGNIALASIVSPTQKEFYKTYAPLGTALDNLVPLGPAFLLKLKSQPLDFDRKMTVELWLYPDGSRILELSTKGHPEEAFQLGAKFRAFLGQSRLMRATEAKTRTSETLRSFN